MAIIFHSDKYGDIKLNSHMIIGVAGYDYEQFLMQLSGNGVYYIGNSIDFSDQKVASIIGNITNVTDEYLNDLGLNKDFLDKNTNDLSHSELKLLKYLKMLINNSSILIIDEPFLDLDYDSKKRIIALFKRLVKKKTIIIGSYDTNVIYTQCKKVLLLGKNRFLYDDLTILCNKNILKQFHILMPEILEFIRLAKDKKIKLPYSKDIRDLIKDVYKNVSK